mmetsp:Transcript_4986/g.10211  ORF Transcript_4986/g.10211 Transcript_4986/m.10211 type:complete len:209 (-) Transcript_4986:295-921(-)
MGDALMGDCGSTSAFTVFDSFLLSGCFLLFALLVSSLLALPSWLLVLSRLRSLSARASFFSWGDGLAGATCSLDLLVDLGGGFTSGTSSSSSSSPSPSEFWPEKCCEKRSSLFRFSCGSLQSFEYFARIVSMSALAYWNNLLFELNITSAISQSQRTLSSIAFFISPFLRFVKVTCLLRSSEMRSIRIFLRPILLSVALPPDRLFAPN